MSKRNSKHPKRRRVISLAHLVLPASADDGYKVRPWARRFLNDANDDSFELFHQYLEKCGQATALIDSEWLDKPSEQVAVDRTVQLVAELVGFTGWDDLPETQAYNPLESDETYMILIDSGDYAGSRLLIGDPFDVYFAWLYAVAGADGHLEMIISRIDAKRLTRKERRRIAAGVIDGMDYDMPEEYEAVFDGRVDSVCAMVFDPGRCDFGFTLREDRINWHPDSKAKG